MKYFIGADLGTSSIKLLLCDKSGNIFATASENYSVSYPRPSWSEQNPSDWWEGFKKGIRKLTKDINPSDIGGICVAGQMHGLVVLDKNDEVIRPVILWNDGRTDKETDYLNTDVGKEKLSSLTANIAFAGFTAPKLLWLQKNEKENFDKIEKIMLPKDYLNYRLTGVHACDFSDASGMLLLDVEHRCWSEEMLNICGVRKEQMPRLFESYEKIGELLPDVAKELGLPSGIPVGAGAGDNAGAAIGTGTIGESRCNISLGTSGTVFISSSSFGVDKNNALHSFCHADGGYHLMGCILSAASCNKWFCDEVLSIEDYSLPQKDITEDMLGNNSVYFLPYLMGERSPINDTNATGTFIGLRPNTTRADMTLAILEGVAFAIRDNVEVARKLGIDIKECTVCGGGAKSRLWMKILANVLDLTVCIPEAEEGPALGAALLASVAAGENESVSEFSKQNIKERISPTPHLAEKYEARYRKFGEIYPRMKELFKIIKE